MEIRATTIIFAKRKARKNEKKKNNFYNDLVSCKNNLELNLVKPPKLK